MFTGLIQGLGEITAIEPRGNETRLAIRPLFAINDYALGESIAVNGVCLTVETVQGNGFTAYASAESMSRTNLGELRRGSTANLERALAFGDRLGGHLVAGHVDCVAQVKSVAPAGESKIYTLSFPAEYGMYVVDKGSVALDGISLTINECAPGADGGWLSVNIIPETQQRTTIAGWTPGRGVNLEVDLIGKYVAKMVGPYAGKGQGKESKITEDFLKQHGFG